MRPDVRSIQWNDIRVLALGLAVLSAGLLLDTDADRVSLGGRALPGSCVWSSVCDGGCPGCGLTRSVVALCHLRWRQSLSLHPAGGLIVAAILLEISYRLSRLLGRGDGVRLRWIPSASRAAMVAALALSAASWLLRRIS
ncbi:MAG: DUF2752 domain-containing protein [Planctomycetes bacterium]|nr:DUF2752 domain-containing protein [Planctomycetota bacterium]